ncbi:YajD family HNH nuclease [Desulfococcaceae bacterium HSG9]|nr:YajD family HNH nuclease [Desulfococcaceae bacterium HSG9]
MSTKEGKNVKQILSEVRSIQKSRENTYREQALKLFPWICGKCGREFSGKRLRELTVHHKDHNHDNNPPDGSNWELLCLYCHDNEHSRNEVADIYDNTSSGNSTEHDDGFVQNPFAGLADLLKDKKPE